LRKVCDGEERLRQVQQRFKGKREAWIRFKKLTLGWEMGEKLWMVMEGKKDEKGQVAAIYVKCLRKGDLEN